MIEQVLTMKRTAALCLVGAFCSLNAQAQNIQVKGNLVDGTGEPLIGATVKVKGNAGVGAVTDLDGNFEIRVKANATLFVSYLGYKEREIAVRGRAIIESIQLSADNQVLDQVVVVGYGTQKKADLTGSVSIVNAEEMKKVSNSNISTMLEGKVAGVQITSDGQPGADPSVRIRGIGSFGSTAPLYVIDGVPMGTTIRDFSPNDIETIQILKDASAGAIYGSRAANGVVIITTKNGKKDQPLKVNYSGYFGVDQIPGDVYDVMNAFSTDTLLFSKWTRDGQCELAERFYLVVACQRDAQGHLASVVMQDINTLQEQEMDWHELEDPARWHMGWN
jgi:tryptophan-rich hypothetical protein